MDGFYRDQVQVRRFIDSDENDAASYAAPIRMAAHVEEHREEIRGVDGVDGVTSHKIATPQRIRKHDRVWLVASDFLDGDDLEDDNAGRVPLRFSGARRRSGGGNRFETFVGR